MEYLEGHIVGVVGYPAATDVPAATNRSEASATPILGQAETWTQQHEKTLRASKRIRQLHTQGITSLGDLWNWWEHRWLSAEELRQLYGVHKSTAQKLALATRDFLNPDLDAAMHTSLEVQCQEWYTDNIPNNILEHESSSLDESGQVRRALWVCGIGAQEAQVQVFLCRHRIWLPATTNRSQSGSPLNASTHHRSLSDWQEQMGS